MRSAWSIGGALVLLAVFATCSDDTVAPPVGDKPVTGDGPVTSGDGLKIEATLPRTDARVDSAWGNNQPACSGRVYKCSDGLDNDGDGKIDSEDPECTGPCDDDEGSFATGIPGDNMDPCKQDCFFDGNSGGGGGDCTWNLKCDPKSPGGTKCPYDPNFKSCPTTQSQSCKDLCLPLSPNGCDCFGCCTIFVNGAPMDIYLGSGPTCSTATPENCTKCTPTIDCLNPCGECELCLGKTIADLPAKCSSKDGGGPLLPQCPTGVTPCLTNAACPAGHYCTTGCCIKGID